MLSARCPCLGDSELNGWEEMAGCRAIGFGGLTAQAQVGTGAIHLSGGGLRRGEGGAVQEGEMDGTLSQ